MKNSKKEIVESTEINKKVYQIKDKNKKEMKKMSTKKLKAILYTTAVLATFSAVSVTSYATENQGSIEDEQEQRTELSITESEKVAEFKTEKQFKKLLKKYQIFDSRTGEEIKYHQLNFKNPNFSLNDEKYKVLNSNQEPQAEFNTNENSYDFAVNFVQSDDYLHANHLASHKFSYSYDLPAEFLKSSTYQKLENQSKIKGYIMWNQKSGTYSVNAMQYQLKNGKLEMVFSSIGSSHFSQQALPKFEVKQK